VAFSGVAKTYQSSAGPVQALDAISLEIAPGSIFGIIGRSGAGKSSLLSLLAGLQAPASGSVLLDGQDIATLPVAERARRSAQWLNDDVLHRPVPLPAWARTGVRGTSV